MDDWFLTRRNSLDLVPGNVFVFRWMNLDLGLVRNPELKKMRKR